MRRWMLEPYLIGREPLGPSWILLQWPESIAWIRIRFYRQIA
jgi:hypothetical protein